MKTCDTCKYWRHDQLVERPQYGFCTAPKVADSRHPFWLGGKYTPADDDAANLVNGDFAASPPRFETGPKFGCIHHTP